MGEVTSADQLYFDDQLLELVLTGPVGEFLSEMVKVAATTLSTAEARVRCGVTMQSAKGFRTTAASDETARRLEELHSDTGEGPWLAALRGSRTTVVQDAASENRWPAYVGRAAADGIRSVCAVPLEAGDHTIDRL